MLTLTAPINTKAAITMAISKDTKMNTTTINTMTKVRLLPVSSPTMAQDPGGGVTTLKRNPRPSVISQ